MKNLLANLFKSDNSKQFEAKNHTTHYSDQMSRMIANSLKNNANTPNKGYDEEESPGGL